MSSTDKARNKAEELTGKAKETSGHVTGDDQLVAEGKADQASAAVKQVGEKVKDAAGNVVDTVKGALGKH